MSELVQSQVVFTAFDPVEGRKGELARINVKGDDFWDLSPDGRWIATGQLSGTDGRIRLLPLAGQAPREIFVSDWSFLESVAWAADGKALFVTGFASKGTPLLRVSLDGKAQLLYRGSKYVESLVPSPDGRYLAFSDMTVESNAWVIENLR
ncbi:MAG: WD40 repeat domain-containing protein [Acidobacteriota bacterium]